MESEGPPSVPTSPPKTAGRKKIKIERIEDNRSRQVTFLKRKNGLLKKAMELATLCGCEVQVILFNLDNGKMFEYCSTDPDKVLQKYATYNGPSERRRTEHFFELAAAKGTSNIPVNEPQVAQSAMEAAAAAAKRPRPVHRFKDSDGPPVQDQYVNGRRLSSGESPGNVVPDIRSEAPHQNFVSIIPQAPRQPTSIPTSARPTSQARFIQQAPIPLQQAHTQSAPSQQPKADSMTQIPSTQLSAPLTTSTSLAAPQMTSTLPPIPNTPYLNTLPTPTAFAMTPRFTGEVNITPLLTPHSASRQLSEALGLRTPMGQAQGVWIPTIPPQPPTPQDANAPHMPSSEPAQNAAAPPPQAVAQVEDRPAQNGRHSSSPHSQTEQRAGKRAKPSLRVEIPHANRDETELTPSGLYSSSSPSSRNEPLPSLGSARFPGSASGVWAPFQGEQMPLTPFLSTDMELTSPANPGLVPLTPRDWFSARREGDKRSFDVAFGGEGGEGGEEEGVQGEAQ